MTDLLAPEGPFFHLLAGPVEALEAAVLPFRNRATVCLLPGTGMPDADGVFRTFQRELGLPDYFGGNWDALDECLSDLEAMPATALLLVLTDAGRVLQHSPEELDFLAEILARTAEAWAEASQPEAPLALHIVLQDSREALEPWRKALFAQEATADEVETA